MSALHHLAERVAGRVPKLRYLLTFCREYVTRFDGIPGEGNGDFETNGERLLLESLAKDLRIVLDVGAHTGDWTSMLLTLNSRIEHVYAFEPCSSTFARLQRQPFPPAVKLRQMALSSHDGTAPIYVLNDSGLGNTFHNRRGLEASHGVETTDRTETVSIRALDSFVAEEKVDQIDLMKIDAEGHEMEVMEGARETLIAGAISRIQFEYGGSYIDARRLLRDAFDFLLPLKYRLFVISGRGLLPCPRYHQSLENYRYKNLLALHENVPNPPIRILSPEV